MRDTDFQWWGSRSLVILILLQSASICSEVRGESVVVKIDPFAPEPENCTTALTNIRVRNLIKKLKYIIV